MRIKFFIFTSLISTSLLAGVKNDKMHFDIEADYVGVWRKNIDHLSMVYYNFIHTDAFDAPVRGIGVADVPMPYSSGLRGLFMFTPWYFMSFELQYMGLYKWNQSGFASNPMSILAVPTPPFNTTSYVHGSLFQYHYHSTFNSGNLTYWWNWTPRHSDYFSFSYLIGVRYIDLRDKIKIDFTKGSNVNPYVIHVINQMFGGEMGVDFESNMNPYFSWGCQTKFGAYSDWIKKKVNLQDGGGANTILHEKMHRTVASYSMEVIPAVYVRLGPTYFRFAYDYLLLFYTGLAPKQLSLRRDITRVSSTVHTSMQSVQVGFGANW